MTGCSCPHPVNEHGTPAQFGTSMCLRADCDCEGTTAELEAQAAAKRALPKSMLLEMCARYVHDMTLAQALQSEILDAFNLEAR